MNKDDFPTFTRPSKLKRRRRTPTTDNQSTAALESNPLKRFAAEPVAKNALLSESTTAAIATTAVANDDIPKSLKTNTGGAAANVSLSPHALASISTILNLDSLTNHFTRGGEKQKSNQNQNQNLILSSAKMVAAQIDYYISASCQYAISGKNNRQHHQRQKLYNSVGNVVHYPTLGVIQLHKDQDEEKESPLKNVTKDFCPMAFPQLRTRSCIDSSRIRKIPSFQSGDGAVVDLNLMILPSISSCLNNTINTDTKSLKYIKIITKHGATIRRHYDLDKIRRNESFSSPGSSSSSSSSSTTTSSDIIGKLMFGAIRPVVECKWLEKPTASLYANMEVEEELVGVMRYKICLLPSDIIALSSHNSDATVHNDWNVNKEKIHGWISDRSRLKSQPYTIAQVIE